MAHPVMFSDDDPGLAELRTICLAYPGADEHVSHGRPTFRCGKIFAAFGGSEKVRPGEHRQVRSALLVKVDESEIPALDEDERFFVPAYYGPFGWRALDLEDPDVDWDEVAELVDASYRLIAPKRRIAELDAREVS
ncbi:MmcQ/YjbR family DNA-binding protein [Mumia sp. ZJ1417]|uniref:MmcQ/YjbR family DNA-binding protein n=1 Tax=unclassified Mumia TaxID=2621872 RepID=UPI00141F77DD|nr:MULTISPECIES: MmcQ/YjbR family DNA-binding protein [unclassified Mumia]QMW64931.1 MmcQ/YjbR family DNA-binding protein [Mumia sp. ZJ1417]